MLGPPLSKGIGTRLSRVLTRNDAKIGVVDIGAEFRGKSA